MFKRHLLPWGLRALLLGMVLLWSLPATAAVTYQQIKSFGPNLDQLGEYPYASLTEGTDGMLYGTTTHGGSAGVGTVFKVNKDGTGYAALHSFSNTGDDGQYPLVSLTEGNDGVLYGTTYRGGNADEGTIFKMNKDGTGYAILRSFGSGVGDARYPWASLIEGNDGVLYGTTYNGGIEDLGTVFKMNKDGTGYAVLRSFSSTGGDGFYPRASLTEGNDGVLYGTTYYGGIDELAGTVFRMNKDGTGYAVLLSFSSTGGDGYNPQASLTEGNDGALYGTTQGGGIAEKGTIFKMKKDGTDYAVLRSFSNTGGDGQIPYAGLTEGSDGVLYGTTVGGGSAGAGTIYKLNKDGTGYAVLRSFGNTAGDGSRPEAGLTKGNDGVLYGTTQGGGSGERGTIFKMKKDGTDYAVLRSFSNTGGDGQNPYAGLTEGSDGVLYGTTGGGGSAGAGTIFKVNKNGTGYAILHSFTGGRVRYPRASLTEGNDGVLYGTTELGGSEGVGTIYKLNKDGMGYAILRSFSNTGGDGYSPRAGLTEGNDGALYGTTLAGGSAARGTIFKMNKDGTGYAILRSFSNTGGDAGHPQVSLTEGNDGVLYGTTVGGGSAGAGTIYKLNKDGTGYAILRSFSSTGNDGAFPEASLTEGNDGVLYGTTSSNAEGFYGRGTVFKVNKNGTGYAVLHRFDISDGDGRAPRGSLTEDNDGVLYGTT